MCGHEVGEIPDEFPNEVLRPLLIEHLMVVLQDYLLILLGEHHRRILGKKKRKQTLVTVVTAGLKSPRDKVQWMRLIAVLSAVCVRSFLQHGLPALHPLRIHSG